MAGDPSTKFGLADHAGRSRLSRRSSRAAKMRRQKDGLQIGIQEAVFADE